MDFCESIFCITVSCAKPHRPQGGVQAVEMKSPSRKREKCDRSTGTTGLTHAAVASATATAPLKTAAGAATAADISATTACYCCCVLRRRRISAEKRQEVFAVWLVLAGFCPGPLSSQQKQKHPEKPPKMD